MSCDGEQEAVCGGKRRRETAGRNQARDHVGKARDLRRGEHDHVRVDHEILQPQDAGVAGHFLTRCGDGCRIDGIHATDLHQA
jgi:hypothetical protein